MIETIEEDGVQFQKHMMMFASLFNVSKESLEAARQLFCEAYIMGRRSERESEMRIEKSKKGPPTRECRQDAEDVVNE